MTAALFMPRSVNYGQPDSLRSSFCCISWPWSIVTWAGDGPGGESVEDEPKDRAAVLVSLGRC